MSEEKPEAGTTIPGEREQQARAQGWSPKDEWRGDPDKWVDAETFLKRGEEHAPIQRERNKYLSRELQEVKELLRIQNDRLSKAEEAGYRRAIAEIRQRKAEAVDNADRSAYDRAEAEEQEIYRQVREAKEATPQTPKVDPEFDAWVEKNPWYINDDDMFAYANGIAATVQAEFQQKGVQLFGGRLYDEVAKRVKKTFAHKFQNLRRQDAPSVEGVTTSAQTKKEKTFDNLPPEAKRSYERFAKQIPGFTKEEYLKNYIWE